MFLARCPELSFIRDTFSCFHGYDKFVVALGQMFQSKVEKIMEGSKYFALIFDPLSGVLLYSYLHVSLMNAGCRLQ